MLQREPFHIGYHFLLILFDRRDRYPSTEVDKSLTQSIGISNDFCEHGFYIIVRYFEG